MPLTADLAKAQFRLHGDDFAPTDIAWFRAAAGDRRAYWRQVAVLARDEVYRQLTRGIGADGRRMPARKRPRHDRASGPVLVPHWSDSRFRTELRWQATEDGAVLWWKSPWGKIVGYHARGEVRGAPVRNVVGVTAEGQSRIRRKAREWWDGKARAGAMGVRGWTMLGGLDGPTPPPAVATAWKPPPRTPGSWAAQLAAQHQAAGLLATSRPVPAVPRPLLPVPRPLVPLPPLVGPPRVVRLHQEVSDFMWAAARLPSGVDEATITAFILWVDREYTDEEIRELLYRLGVTEPVGTREELLELLKRQLIERLRTAA